MKGDQKKVVSNEQKTTQSPSKHQREGYQSLFQSTNVGRDPPRGLWPTLSPQNWPESQCIARQNGDQAGGGVSKSNRNQPNTTQTSKQRQPSSFQPKKSNRVSLGGVWPSFRKSQILAILECGNRTFNLFPTFSKIDRLKKLWAFCWNMKWEHFSRKGPGLNIHATPDLIQAQTNFRLRVPAEEPQNRHTYI